jgi:hypothetical protein
LKKSDAFTMRLLTTEGNGPMTRIRRPAFRPTLIGLSVLLATAGPARVDAQQLLYDQTPSYSNAQGYGDGLNYNADYLRYGLPGVGVSPWDPIVQAQLNLGLKTARYNMLNAWTADDYQAANLYNQQAIAQSLRNARQEQVLQPRYDVRRRLPHSVSPPAPRPPAELPRDEYVSTDGTVRWPDGLPTDPAFQAPKAAAEAAIRVAVKEFEADGKASVQSVAEAKSQLFAYGQPVIRQVNRTNHQSAKDLLAFFRNLEQTLDRLAGE